MARILLVEDDPVEAKAIQRILGSRQEPSYRVYHAPSLEEAGKFIQRERFDLVLLDKGITIRRQ